MKSGKSIAIPISKSGFSVVFMVNIFIEYSYNKLNEEFIVWMIEDAKEIVTKNLLHILININLIFF